MRWHKFTKKFIRPHKMIYKVEVRGYPDIDAETKADAERTVKLFRKVGLKARYKKMKNGIALEISGTKLVT